ncbi:hypothetical protein D3C76_1270280 [compost metagenome]
MKAKTGLARVIPRAPIVTRSFQQGVSTNDIGLDEFSRPADRAIFMRLGGQMHDRIGLVLLQNAVNLHAVTDINPLENIARALADLSQGFKISGISQLIDVDYRVAGVGDDMSNDCRADKARAASD